MITKYPKNRRQLLEMYPEFRYLSETGIKKYLKYFKEEKKYWVKELKRKFKEEYYANY